MGRRFSVLTATVFLVLLVFAGTALAVVPTDEASWTVDGDFFIEGASKPTVCYDKDGEVYHLWYLSGTGVERKLYHQTSDNLDTWTEDAVPCTGYNLTDYADNAFIIKTDEANQFYLWCTDTDGTEIVRLSSTDGKEWGDPVNVLSKGEGDVWDGDKIDHPMVIKDDGEYKMYYQGRNEAGDYCIGLATANSLIGDFSRHGDNPVLKCNSDSDAWDSYRVFQPWVVKVSDRQYYMFYAGNTTGNPAGIGVATSADGEDWTNAEEPILTRGDSGSYAVAHPAVAHLNGTWHLWFLKNGDICHATAISNIGATKITFNVTEKVVPGDPMYPAIIAISVPTDLEFGDIEIGSTKSKGLTIENIGNVDVGVECKASAVTGDVTISVDDPDNIAVGATETVTVTVTAGSDIGTGSATITVTATAVEQ